MASTSNTNHERALLEGPRHAVHGLRAPFASGGTLVPEQPVTLCFRDTTQIPELRARDIFEQERLLQPLVVRCAVAAFGIGRKTRYDRNVRDALQINAEPPHRWRVSGWCARCLGVDCHNRSPSQRQEAAEE